MKIIAGEARGRPLVVPSGRGTRPPLERMRESLFDVIGEIDGAEVLDLFAGAGAFGLEAISRGARMAVFVERDPAALRALERNIRDLGFGGRALIVRGDALAFPGGRRGASRGGDEPPEAYDLIFADPPFALFATPEGGREVIDRAAALVGAALRPGGILLLRRPSKAAVEAPIPPRDVRRYGESTVIIFSRPDAAPDAGPGRG